MRSNDRITKRCHQLNVEPSRVDCGSLEYSQLHVSMLGIYDTSLDYLLAVNTVLYGIFSSGQIEQFA